MSFTPIHLIAGIPAAKKFDYWGFFWVNVWIDVDVLITLLLGDMYFSMEGKELPLHGFIHSFFGALSIATVYWLITDKWHGAVVGAVSHIMIDMFCHQDVKPFAPFTDANPFYGIVSMTTVDVVLLSVSLPLIFWQLRKVEFTHSISQFFSRLKG